MSAATAGYCTMVCMMSGLMSGSSYKRWRFDAGWRYKDTSRNEEVQGLTVYAHMVQTRHFALQPTSPRLHSCVLAHRQHCFAIHCPFRSGSHRSHARVRHGQWTSQVVGWFQLESGRQVDQPPRGVVHGIDDPTPGGVVPTVPSLRCCSGAEFSIRE